ncbi:MAG: S8 family serine peptidase, partial [Candidatus Krumholzibacteriia bacterium]
PQPERTAATAAAPDHRRRTASSLPPAERRTFAPVLLPAKTAGATAPARDPDLHARLAALTSPLMMRGGAAAAPGLPPRAADKADLPWTANRLLANPTDMNDEYVSLAVSPLTGDLWATFAATDLGGTDRDIHIARSGDDGLTWTVWELPSAAADEYHPDLAVDAAGYLHVVWVAEPGVLMRARSAAADDPLHWAFVEGLAADEPLATPTIAVSGGGDFARVFIATAWYTANYDLYAYEWTLLFMYSGDGGRNVTYDYFLPDGYPEYWPDVAMDGTLVHFVNAEADYYTGQLEVLVASDQYNGSFVDVASMTGWTPNNCGFPRLACQDEQVFVVYQHDWSDGLSTDGDIIYAYSWDRAASWFGPVEMIADPYESVGPTVFTRNGVVGCLWLDAPPGGDEFHLAARLGSGGGHSGLFGGVEIVTDQPRVEPQFHAIAGVATGQAVHAAWIDRRDHPTEGHNVYTGSRPVRADLALHQPDGWAAALVAAPARGGRTDTWLAGGDTTFVSFAFLNAGLADAGTPFTVRLDLDGAPQAAWTVDGLPAGAWAAVEDHPLVVPAGAHTLAVRLDPTDQVPEDDETDNTIARTLTWIDGDAIARAEPGRLVIGLEPALAAAAVAALVQDPPLLRTAAAAVIDPALARALDKALGQEPLRVVIVPHERLDAAALARALDGTVLPVRRDAVLAAARGRTGRSLADLQPHLDQLARAGLAAAPRPLWLSGMIAVACSPLAVEQLAALPEVGALWLDDQPSRTFGEPGQAAAKAVRAWHLDRVGAPDAWTRGLTGAGVLVGHVDTGIAYDHPDLAAHLWDGGVEWPHHGWDAIDEDNDPYDGDTDWWHGTHTAGLIAGDGTAGTATGVAPGARLMALRGLPGYYDDLVESLQFGLDKGVDLFSLSGGWTGASEAIRVANRYNADVLMAAGVPWICAAGNGDNQGGHLALPGDVSSPGDCPSPWFAPNGGATAVITVGALTVTDEPWSSSSTGPVRWDYANPYGDADYRDYPWPSGLMKPDLAAPGDPITSTSGAGGYVTYAGTSMATPLVAGAAAILLEAAPGLTPTTLAQLLETTARDVTAAPAVTGRDNHTGAGLVDLAAALDHLGEAGPVATLTLHNDGVLPLVVSAVLDDGPWLQAGPPAGPVAPGASVDLPVFVDPTGLQPGVHTATLIILSNDPASPLLVPVVLDYGSGLSGVEDGPPPAAGRAQLESFPNPFNPRTVLRFAARGGVPAELAVYDVRGRRVRTLVQGVLDPGPQEVAWDGRDERGRGVPSGQYFARLQEGEGEPAVRKLMLVR